MLVGTKVVIIIWYNKEFGEEYITIIFPISPVSR